MQLLSLLKEMSLHPKNAEELKGLILQLAVQGKLTAKWRAENPNTEPASELLKRIEAEKQKLIADKKIKKEKPADTISTSDITFIFPEGWAPVRIQNISILKAGGDVPKSRFSKEKTTEYQVPIYANGEKNNGLYGFTDEPIITSPSLTVSGRGTIGFTVLRKEPFYPIVRLIVITPICELTDLEFLKLSIQATDFKKTGTSIPQLTVPMVKNKCIVVLPPLEEQKAIVEVVNQLFKEVEQLEELTKERIALKEDFLTSALNALTTSESTSTEWEFLKGQFSTFFTETSSVKKLRETILQLAVQGKLTSKWRAENPNTEPASELLKRIETEKQQLIANKKIKKEKPLPPISQDEIPYELPEGWEWCRFIHLNYDLHYGYTASAKDTFENVGLLRITDIQNNRVNWLTVPDCDIKEKDVPKYLLAENDILIARTGGTIGKSYIVKEIGERKAVFASYLIRAIPSKIAYAPYLKLFIESPTYWEQLYENSQGTGQPNVNATSLKGLVTPLPSMNEQKYIVQKVDALMVLCDELEQQIKISQTQIEQLMQSCLKEVFG